MKLLFFSVSIAELVGLRGFGGFLLVLLHGDGFSFVIDGMLIVSVSVGRICLLKL